MEAQHKQVKKRSQKDYSLSFKLQLVGEIERGELNFSQANKKYGIQGHTTVSKWFRKYSTLDWKELPIMTHKKTPEQRIKELETLLLMEKEKVHILNVAINIADDLLKTDIRKKYMPKQSKKQKPKS
jgi:transposase-like protein